MTSAPREILLRDVEEAADRYIHRPVAALLVKRLIATRVTPNSVTILAGALGVLAGVLLFTAGRQSELRMAGGIALLASCILDCADGQLARARGTPSITGMILDGLTDNVVGTAVFVGMAHEVVVYTAQPWLWLLGIAAGLSAAAHVWVFDARKKQYLQCLGLTAPDEAISVLASQRRQARRRGSWSEVILLSAYEFFRRAQDLAASPASASASSAFRRANRRRMRIWTYMGSGTHFFALYVAALVSPFWPPALLACSLLYVGLNVIFFVLLFDGWA